MRAAIILGVMFFAWLPGADAAPYIGLDGNRYSITLKGSDSDLLPQSAGGESLYIGDRFGDLAGEIGYGTSKYTGNGTVDNFHLTRLTADGILDLPVFGTLNILATAGGSETNYGISTYARNYYQVLSKAKSTNADMTVLEGDEFDWRAGAGFSLRLYEFELRALARYQPLSMQHQAQNAISLDFGVNVDF